MTIRNILVPVADRPECAIALKTAFRLANKLGANVTGAHIRAHAEDEVKLPKSILKQAEGLSLGAEKLFNRAAKEEGLDIVTRPRAAGASAMWKKMKGAPDLVLPVVGQMADMIVVSRPKSKKKDTARLFLEGALLHTGRPVLVMPQTGNTQVGDVVAIAWDRSAVAARAVKMALPLLAAAKEVHIIEITDSVKHGLKANELASYLAWHGINAKHKKIKRAKSTTSTTLLDAAKDCKADMLVMGAYTRNRFAETIFGGVTDYMSYEAKIPVLMAR